jgi:V8-like Glu-specific endopeptidase
MQLRILTTALLLGAAVASTPVLAQTSPGNAGPAEIPATRGAPTEIPAGATASPLGKVDASATSRGAAALDPAGAVESFGTETLNRDGSTDSTPASEGLRAILEQSVAGSEPASTDRVVVGPDDREQITDASGYPDRVVGWLFSQAQDDSWSTCTATLIGPYTVLTAAHCVYIHEKGGWIKDVLFLPGLTNPDSAPFGTYSWANINILKGYIENHDGSTYDSVFPWDLAVITLEEDAGNMLGWLGFRVDDGTQWAAKIIGYPGDKPDGTMWRAACDIAPDQFNDVAYWHECDTFSGSSGSSMYEENKDGNYYVRGINVAGDEKVNWGIRLSESYFQFIVDNYK